MKRVGYLYEKICDEETLQRALNMAVQGKRNKPFAQKILKRRDALIAKLRDDLLNERFTPSVSKRKTITEQPKNKTREIAVPRLYPDHIVHWAVCIALNDVFLRGMYSHNVGCIPGRGCKAGINYIKRMLKENKARYVLKLDIRKYFQHINHDKLKELLRRKIKDRKALHLLDQIIDAGGEGLPIGFYTSQWLSNFYLEAVDHYIKETLKIKYYVRNVDDMVLADTNKRKLHKARKALAEYLRKEGYGIEIKPDWQLWRIHTRPIDFLGYLFYKDKTLMRRKNFYRFTRRVQRVKKRGYCTERGARQIAAGLGQLKNTPGGKHYYLNSIKPIIAKREISKIISAADKRRKERTMIYKDGTNAKIESLKDRLGLTGDVYLVGQNYMESLESHKRLLPESTAATIEEAEAERLAFMEAEREMLAKLAAEAEAETKNTDKDDEKKEEETE